jgi:Holliday junction resolvase RusA-like endonuclease
MNKSKTGAQVVLPFPPSTNTAYPSSARGGRHLSKAGKTWLAEAAPLIEEALQGFDLPEQPRIEIELQLLMPDNRTRDLDNYIKLPKDAVCAELSVDDNHRTIPSLVLRSLGVRDKQRGEEGYCVIVIRILR